MLRGRALNFGCTLRLVHDDHQRIQTLRQLVKVTILVHMSIKNESKS